MKWGGTFQSRLAPLWLALAYWITGYLGLLFPAFGADVTLVWLPTGIAVGFLRRWGYWTWPGIALGAMTVNLSNGNSLSLSAGITIGNTLGPLLTARLLSTVGFRNDFGRSRDILLLGGAAAIGMTVSATGGVACLALAGELSADYGKAWAWWWAGDATGVLLAAPLVLSVGQEGNGIFWARWGEFAAWVAVIGIVGVGVFIANSSPAPAPLAFLPLPLIVWGAMRFGPVGTSLGVILLAFVAAGGTSTGHGPFAQTASSQSAVLVWLFMLACVVLAWLVSALNAAQLQAEATLRESEERWKFALEGAGAGVIDWDVASGRLLLSDRWLELTGYGPGQLSETVETLKDLVHPDDRPHVLRDLEKTLSGTQSVHAVEHRLRCADGRWIWVQSRAIVSRRGTDLLPQRVIGTHQDITERKQAEAAIATSERMLRLVLDNIPQGVFWKDRQSTYLGCNQVVTRTSGLATPETLIGMNDGQLSGLTHEQVAFFVAKDREVMDRNRPEFGIIERATLPDGSTIWMETNKIPMHDAAGTVVGILGTWQDITARKQAEEAQRESEERLRLALDAAGLATWDWHIDNGQVIWNDKHFLMLGYKPGSVTPSYRVWAESIHPDDLARTEVHLRHAMEIGGDYNSDFRTRWPDGTVREIEAIGRFVRNAAGRAVRSYGVMRDVTERKRAETALRESEARYRTLFETSTDAIFLLDLTGRIRAANPAAARMHGYTHDELLARRIQDLDVPESAAQAPDRLRKMIAGEVLTFEVIHRRKDGTTFPVEVLGSVIELDGERLVMAFDRDITQRKQAEVRQASLAKILETSLNEIYIFDRTSLRFLEVNRAARTNLGYDMAKLREMTPLDLKAYTADEFGELIAPLRSGQAEKLLFETIHRRKDGTSYPVEVHLQAGTYGEHAVLVALITDITERKKAAQREAEHILRLRHLAELSLTLSGEPGAVFERVVRMIGELFAVRVVCLSEIVGSELLFRSVYANGEMFADAGRCPIAVTPCVNVEANKEIQVFDRVVERFPDAEFLRQHAAYTYCGFPSVDNEGRVVAITCLLDDKPHDFSEEDRQILRIIGQRLATEVERRRVVEEQKRAEVALQEAERRQRLALDAGRMGTWDWEIGSDQLTWDEREVTLFGFSPGEFDSLLATFLSRVHPDDLASVHQVLADAATGKNFDGEFRIVLPSGDVRWIHGTGAVCPGNGNYPARLIGINYDISDRVRAEEQLRNSIREKEAMLKEIHHRVKNNLQVISSLLNLQAERLTDPVAKAVFLESQNRVRAMALVHETLYGSESLARIELPRYIDRLCDSLLQTFGGTDRVSIERAVSPVTLDLDRAVPAALIVSELVSNALKYAFPDGRRGKIRVSVEKADSSDYNLTVTDDGIGLPPDLDLDRTPSLGLYLVRVLARQLRGTLEIGRAGGTSFTLRFPA